MIESKNKINLLPPEVYNKIAAGEVVRRPESVIKELIENSIDAGAKNITVVVKNAGKKLLSVTDDGEGMSEEDLKLSILRHSTSKVKLSSDLENLSSFGFRGEALSSIAAVSRIEIKSRRAEDSVATKLFSISETEFETEKISAGKGTTVTVKNLFYNVPARKSFLKSDATELKRINNIIKYFALAYPEINFKFYNENKLQLDFHRGDLNSRMKSVFGENILSMLVEVYEQIDFIEVSGFISKPTFLTDSKFEQHLFVNRRYVKNKSVNHAVFSAYQNILSKGEFPFFVLFIDIDPSKTDVNIHPSKEEIKFYDEKEVYLLVNAVVKKSLGSYNLIPKIENEIESGSSTNKSQNVLSIKHNRKDNPSLENDELDLLFGKIESEMEANNSTNIVSHPFAEQNNKVKREVEHISQKGNSKENSNKSNFVVNLHNKFILTQIKSGLMVIDAHLASIRIFYDKAIASLSTNFPFSQQLLFVQTLRLGKDAYKVLQKYDNLFTSIGFEIKYFSNFTISITGVPSDVNIGSEVKVLLSILEEILLTRNKSSAELTKEKFAEIYSRNIATKLDESVPTVRMNSLVDQLFATSNPYSTPCGKTIIAKISLNEIENKFGKK